MDQLIYLIDQTLLLVANVTERSKRRSADNVVTLVG